MAFFNPQSREIEKKNLLNLWIMFFHTENSWIFRQSNRRSSLRKREKRPKQGDYHIENSDKKVTIILLISFQLSYNKVDKDLYNPI
jgi:hypothetical protein